MRDGSSRQFRLIDLSVIILMAVPLLTIVLWGVSRARETARRHTCERNISRLLLALHDYEQATGFYPAAANWTTQGIDINTIYQKDSSPWPNITAIPPGTGQDITLANWSIELLPYLSRDDLAGLHDRRSVMSSTTQESLRIAEPSEFRCPSDEYASATLYKRPGSEERYARGNYAINGGSHRHCPMPGWLSDPCSDGFLFEFFEDRQTFEWHGNGIAGINKRFRQSDLKNRGASLVAVDEIRAGIDEDDPRGVWSLGQIGGSIAWAHGMTGDASGPNARSVRSDDIVGCDTLTRRYGADYLIHVGMPCCSYCPGNEQATARSMHAGGVFVGFVDGSTRFMTNEVDDGLWHVIHSRYTPPEFARLP